MVHRDAGVRLTKTPRKPYRKRQPVEVVRVDPLVMKEALRLAEGDARRLEIVSAVEVIVH